MIVPAYNEGQNIQGVVQELSAQNAEFDILVIDDGSKDNTALMARQAQTTLNMPDLLQRGLRQSRLQQSLRDKSGQTRASVITLPFNLGVGGAVQTGFIYARRNDYDLALQIDGDGQHDPRYIGPLIQPILEGRADMTIGSRFIKPFLGYQSSFVRRIGIHFFARLISLLTGYTITDPTSGFRAFNQKAIRIFLSDYPLDYPEPEAIVLAKKYGLRLMEVPVEMRERLYGLSSIRYLHTLYYMVKVTFAIALDMLKKKGELT